MSAIPTETEAWILQGQNGADSLEKIDNHRLPVLGDHDVLVQLHAASLNYRDIAIAKVPYTLKFTLTHRERERERASNETMLI